MSKRYYCTGAKTDTYDSCCRLHDNAYGKYGRRTADGAYFTRAQADEELRQCIIARGMPAWQARLVWLIVRGFGWAFWHKHKVER